MEIFSRYADNHSGTSYNTAETDIVRHAHGKSLNLRGNIQINKSHKRPSLSVLQNLIAGGGETEIDYTGSNGAFNGFTPVLEVHQREQPYRSIKYLEALTGGFSNGIEVP